jgi:flagellar hook-associated protein 2
MPEISFGGLASGLPADLVDKLIEIQQRPLQRLESKKVEIQTRLNAVQGLNARLLTMKTAMEELSTPADFNVRTATSSDDTFAAVTASAGAAVGSYAISNVVLADNDQLRLTTGVTSKNDPLAGGTFAFTYAGGAEQQITITGGETMGDLATKINALNAGVGATIINDGTSDYLVLTGNDTGLANSIAVTVSTTLTGFEAADFTSVSTAADASFNLDGLAVTSASNTVTGAVEGVTINLKQATAGETINLAVNKDSDGLKEKVQSFIDAYNGVATLISQQSQYDPISGARSVLFGDPAVRGIQTQMRRMISEPIAGLTGTYTTLAELGITSKVSNGTLELDETKLTTAIDTDFDGVGKLFYDNTTTQGYGKQFLDYLTDVTDSTTGFISSKEDSINSQVKTLDRQIEATQRRLEKIEQRIRFQFSSMENLVNNLNGNSAGAIQSLQNMASTPFFRDR